MSITSRYPARSTGSVPWVDSYNPPPWLGNEYAWKCRSGTRWDRVTLDGCAAKG
jgi:hypothetical protein